MEKELHAMDRTDDAKDGGGGACRFLMSRDEDEKRDPQGISYGSSSFGTRQQLLCSLEKKILEYCKFSPFHKNTNHIYPS